LNAKKIKSWSALIALLVGMLLGTSIFLAALFQGGIEAAKESVTFALALVAAGGASFGIARVTGRKQ